ncbi:hypothetical protein AB670_00580 [Chryseobacterium sp. MOF25P]|uniref:hypothetical protein n=1 Tax=unclassified Chryseobacterium TaxID=2593645 RepID=UPI000805EAF0|nr:MULTISPECIES: hypothetical protein [unclassified Chryseobacterium]OBW43037.1 hypothetical protein AB670_00580 [Chryseobacterium sp. MOF25P]OBW44511.1 hypothetical protein AB671_03486 [Chryseobacterium sp. BGARF1]
MKKLLIIPILSSVSFSAQVSSRIPLKIDSIKFPKIEKSLIVTPSEITKFDSSIAKLYKMPVAKPKNHEMYSSLKASKKDTTLHKMPNLLDVAKPPKLSAK